MGRKQMSKRRKNANSTKMQHKNKVCRRCELGYDSTKLDDITGELESSIASYEIKSVLLSKKEKLSLWERIKRWIKAI